MLWLQLNDSTGNKLFKIHLCDYEVHGCIATYTPISSIQVMRAKTTSIAEPIIQNTNF